MKYIKTFENIDQEIQEIKPNILYKYANNGYIAIGKLKKNEDSRSDYKIIIYDFIDNKEHYVEFPCNTNYKIKKQEKGIASHGSIISKYLNFATQDDIEAYNTIKNIDKYNL